MIIRAGSRPRATAFQTACRMTTAGLVAVTQVIIGCALLCATSSLWPFVAFTAMVAAPGLAMAIVRWVPAVPHRDDGLDWMRVLARGPADARDDDDRGPSGADIEAYRRAYNRMVCAYVAVMWIGNATLCAITWTADRRPRDSCSLGLFDGSVGPPFAVAYFCVYIPTGVNLGRLMSRLCTHV